MKTRLTLALLAIVALLLGACSQGGAPSGGDTAYHGPLDGQEYGDYVEPPVVVFNDLKAPYRYDDGITIMPQLTTGKVDSQVISVEDRYAAPEDLPQIGEGYVNVLLVVKNDTDQPFDALNLMEVFTYGPNAKEPEMEDELQYKSHLTGFNTKILPGRQRIGGQTWLVPEQNWKDVTLEISREGFPTVIWTGAL